jgi:hypothetical protein
LIALKNPAFQEEKEIRLVHAVNFIHSSTGTKLVSAGGTAWGKTVEGQEIRFRMKEEIPVPYVALDFTNRGKVNPIKKIILGPKNRNLPSNIRLYLNTLEIYGVTIEKSAASYA